MSNSVTLLDTAFLDLVPNMSYNPVGLAHIPPTATHHEFLSHTLLLSLTKKFRPRDSSAQDRLAREKFVASNKKCNVWVNAPNTSGDEELLGSFKSELDNFFHPKGLQLWDSYVEFFERGRCGPGASVGVRRQHEYFKLFAGPITSTTKELYEMYRAYAFLYPEWSNAELIRMLNHGEARYVDGSLSSFVPKTNKISRMICTEPSLNMFIQLGIGEIIGDRLKSYLGINLEDQQTVNQLLARIGSTDGSYATIDLESASDSISINMLKEYLPSWAVDTLLYVRSPVTTLPGGERVQLAMMSTMGNGFTFPLQTAIFGCAVAAVYRHAGLALYKGSRANFSVFGDDIICETRVFHRVSRLLGLLGFTVNSDKTFATGLFRESCGHDWLNGQPVRGVYIKALNRPRDYAVSFNLIMLWSAIHAIPMPKTLQWLWSRIPYGMRNLIPRGEGLDGGIAVPWSVARNHGLRSNKNGSPVYRINVPVTKRVRADRKSLLRSRIMYNLSGLFVCAVKGSLRGNTITLGRPGGFDFQDGLGQLWTNVEYGIVRRVTPNWDYPYGGICVQPPPGDSDRLEAWRRWETAVEDFFLNTPAEMPIKG